MRKVNSQSDEEYMRGRGKKFHTDQAPQDGTRTGDVESWMSKDIIDEHRKLEDEIHKRNDRPLNYNNPDQISQNKKKMIETNKQFISSFKNQLQLNYPDANHKFHPPNNNLPSNILPNNSNKIPLNELGFNNLKIPNNPSLDNRMNSSANNIQNPYLRSSQNDRNNASMNKSTNYFEKSSTNNDFTPNLTETGPSMRNANDFSCSEKGAKKKKNEARPSQNINSNWDDKELDYIYESEENHYSDKINQIFPEIEQFSLNSNCSTELGDVTWKNHEDIDVDVLYNRIFQKKNEP